MQLHSREECYASLAPVVFLKDHAAVRRLEGVFSVVPEQAMADLRLGPALSTIMSWDFERPCSCPRLTSRFFALLPSAQHVRIVPDGSPSRQGVCFPYTRQGTEKAADST